MSIARPQERFQPAILADRLFCPSPRFSSGLNSVRHMAFRHCTWTTHSIVRVGWTIAIYAAFAKSKIC